MVPSVGVIIGIGHKLIGKVSLVVFSSRHKNNVNLEVQGSVLVLQISDWAEQIQYGSSSLASRCMF